MTSKLSTQYLDSPLACYICPLLLMTSSLFSSFKTCDWPCPAFSYSFIFEILFDGGEDIHMCINTYICIFMRVRPKKQVIFIAKWLRDVWQTLKVEMEVLMIQLFLMSPSRWRDNLLIWALNLPYWNKNEKPNNQLHIWKRNLRGSGHISCFVKRGFLKKVQQQTKGL